MSVILVRCQVVTRANAYRTELLRLNYSYVSGKPAADFRSRWYKAILQLCYAVLCISSGNKVTKTTLQLSLPLSMKHRVTFAVIKSKNSLMFYALKVVYISLTTRIPYCSTTLLQLEDTTFFIHNTCCNILFIKPLSNELLYISRLKIKKLFWQVLKECDRLISKQCMLVISSLFPSAKVIVSMHEI